MKDLAVGTFVGWVRFVIKNKFIAP